MPPVPFIVRPTLSLTLPLLVFALLSTLVIDPGQFTLSAFQHRAPLIALFLIAWPVLHFSTAITITETTLTHWSPFRALTTHNISDIVSIADDNENAGWFVPTETKIQFADGDYIILPLTSDPHIRTQAIAFLRSRAPSSKK
jgi:hypothetical protein